MYQIQEQLRIMMAVGEELEPAPPRCDWSYRGAVVGGLDTACCGHRLAAAMALADERRRASGHVLSSADENAQNPNGTAGKQTRENCCDRLPTTPQISNTVLQTRIASLVTR
jgi:hypothetical protein